MVEKNDWSPAALQKVAMGHKPNLPIMISSTWVAILLHTKPDIKSITKETDFLWFKCHHRITILTLKSYYFHRLFVDDITLKHEGYFPKNRSQVKDLRLEHSFGGNVIVLRAIEREESDSDNERESSSGRWSEDEGATVTVQLQRESRAGNACGEGREKENAIAVGDSEDESEFEQSDKIAAAKDDVPAKKLTEKEYYTERMPKSNPINQNQEFGLISEQGRAEASPPQLKLMPKFSGSQRYRPPQSPKLTALLSPFESKYDNPSITSTFMESYMYDRPISEDYSHANVNSSYYLDGPNTHAAQDRSSAPGTAFAYTDSLSISPQLPTPPNQSIFQAFPRAPAHATSDLSIKPSAIFRQLPSTSKSASPDHDVEAAMKTSVNDNDDEDGLMQRIRHLREKEDESEMLANGGRFKEYESECNGEDGIDEATELLGFQVNGEEEDEDYVDMEEEDDDDEEYVNDDTEMNDE